MPEAESIPAFSLAESAPDAAATPVVTPVTPTRRKRNTRTRKGAPPPVLVEVHRGGTVESRHRGHIVVVNGSGAISHAAGAPSQEIMLRSTAKPFGVVALVESGAADDLALTPTELAIMCASHTGEDKHVRTLQSIFRRASVTQTLLRCGTEGAPADAGTAARLARDGETPGAIRHRCSGFHAASILMSAYAGWSLEDYDEPGHPSQVAMRETVARLFGQVPDTLKTGIDDCGAQTYQVTLLDLARAYLLLAHPESAADEPRQQSAGALARLRDAMMSAPEMVGGTYGQLDTELMRGRPGSLVSKAGSDGMRGVGLVAKDGAEPAGIAIKIDDGDLSRRAIKAASVETLAQIGVLDDRDLRALESFHRPTVLDPAGREAASSVPRFDLPRLDR